MKPISFRDVRLVKLDKDRKSIVLDVAAEWIEVVPVEGGPGGSPYVLVPHPSALAERLKLAKETYFRSDRVDWVEREDVGEVLVAKKCPWSLIERIWQMQQRVALGEFDLLEY